MSLTRTVAWNTVVQVAGRAVGLLASMAVTALLTRHLGLAQYGQMVTAATFVGLFSILGDAGLYLAIVRRAAQEPERRSQILGAGFGLRLVLAAAPMIAAYLLIQVVPADRFPTYGPAVKLAVAVCAVNTYITLLNQLLIAVFRLHLRMDLAAGGEFLSRVVSLGAVVWVVHSGGGLIAACIAVSTGPAANFVYAWFVTRRFERFVPHFDRAISRELLGDSVVLTMVTLLGLIHFKVDTLLLSVLRTPTDVGVYGVAYKLHEVLITFPGLFVGLLFPVFSRLATTDVPRLQQVFQRTFEVLLLASVGAATVVFVAAPPLAAILGAPEAAHAMRVLAFALPAVFVSLGFTHLLLAEGRQGWLVRMYFVLVVVNIGANVVAIRAWSYMGAAAVTVATESMALAALAGYWIGRRRWRLQLRVLTCVPLAAGLAVAGCSLGRLIAPSEPTTRILELAVRGGFTGLSYAGAVLALRLVPLATLRALRPGTSPAAAGASRDAL